MSAGRIAATVSLGAVALLLLLGWATWTFVLDRIDRVMIMDLLGFYSLGGQ